MLLLSEGSVPAGSYSPQGIVGIVSSPGDFAGASCPPPPIRTLSEAPTAFIEGRARAGAHAK